MAPAILPQPKWTAEFDTLRREKLFRNPPKDRTAYPSLQAAVQPHIASYNALFGTNGLIELGLQDIGTKTIFDGLAEGMTPRGNRIDYRLKEIFIEMPHLPPSNKISATNRNIFPAECRERHASYRGKLRTTLQFRINNGPWHESIRELGNMPIMLKSKKCHLEKLSPAGLVRAKEESDELGGYFIINGNEKIVRMLILPKRNYPTAIIRSSFQNRGPTYSKYGVSIRGVRPDQTSQTNVLHYLNDGNIIFRFSWRKNEYLVPVMLILKALVETNDREIFENIIGPEGSKALENTFLTDRVELLLRTFKFYGIHGRAGTRAFLGQKFRVVLNVAADLTDEQVGTEFLRKIVLVHLGSSRVTESQDKDKFNLLIFMIRKLYALSNGDCAEDNPDTVQNQEILMGGFFFSMILKERLEEYLFSIGYEAQNWINRKPGVNHFAASEIVRDFVAQICRRTNEDVGHTLEYFMSTGNLSSPSGLDLQQTSGFTVVAEKINFYRFISHFRMVHRGTFFAELKTTTVRKLLPESWGFLCPVHTPDGSPCGLLNHLAHKCHLMTKALDTSSIEPLLQKLGLQDHSTATTTESVCIQLDGRILGWCSPQHARTVSEGLRYWKVRGEHNIPVQLEIGYIPNSNGGQYPGIYMFSHRARMIRPVKHLALDKEDWVGPFEQPYMSIAAVPHEIETESTHVEYDPTNILSMVANQTPFSDFNQSPRNMYQCQMGKQSMGTPGTAMRYRSDNKTYLLQTGQTPIVRPPLYNEYGLDNFPNGMNAVVAVISYTGYDMDDAMIINKSAHERGFGHGTIFKTKKYDFDSPGRSRAVTKLFGFAPGTEVDESTSLKLGEDGLPHIGALVREGDVVAAYHTVSATEHGTLENRDGVTSYFKYSDSEEAFVSEVRLLGVEAGNEPLTAISIKFRVPRSPVIGDKFSSRHGQKGVCSQKWPAVGMPFSESGIQPDVIINPHAFPSRMTIGMFVESLAGKAGALHGIPQDCTPWKFDEENTAADYFGDQLKGAGFNYFGNEPMYSGITGEEFAADIFIGVVYYQRLRHMVNDKFQVRTTGAVSPLTQQPVKGRKKGGGIRVGEMERDSLLAHGCAFLLQDRLLNCSDLTKSWICRDCGSFASITPAVSPLSIRGKGAGTSRGSYNQHHIQIRCRSCAKTSTGLESKSKVWQDGQGNKFVGGENTTVVAIPYVLKYLDVELASMGIKITFNVEP